MASSLRKQLEKLRVPEQRKHLQTFIFDEKESNKIELETVFKIGLDGLQELRKLDERFGVYEKTLFSDTSKQINRELLTTKENHTLSQSISSLLRLLSGYFLLRSAHCVLEYLIRRYQITLYDQRGILECILPYHSTLQFSKMIRLLSPTLKLVDKNHHLAANTQLEIIIEFFQVACENYNVLDRSVLVSQCCKHLGLAEFVCETVRSAYQEKTLSKSAVAFYSLLLIQLIATVKAVEDNLLSLLIIHVVHGVKSISSPDLQSANYSILAQLSSKVLFSEKVFSLICDSISGFTSNQSFDNAVACIVLLCFTQSHSSEDYQLPSLTVQSLCKSKLIPVLLELTTVKNYNIDEFMNKLFTRLPSLVLFEALESKTNGHSSLNGEESGKKGKLMKFTLNLLQTPNIVESFVQIFVESLFSEYIKHREGAGKKGRPENFQFRENLDRLVKVIDQRYPQQFNDGISKKIEFDEVNEKYYTEFIEFSFHKGLHQKVADSNTTLMFSLQSDKPILRLSALQQLVSSDPQTLQDDFFKDNIVERITDDDSSVSSFALSLPLLFDLLSPSQMIDATSKAIAKHGIFTSVGKNALLTLADPRILSESFSTILPWILELILVTRQTTEEDMIFSILPSLEKSKLLPNFAAFVSRIRNSVRDKENKLKANFLTVEYFANNFEHFDHETQSKFISLIRDPSMTGGRLLVILILNKILEKKKLQFSTRVEVTEALFSYSKQQIEESSMKIDDSDDLSNLAPVIDDCLTKNGHSIPLVSFTIQNLLVRIKASHICLSAIIEFSKNGLHCRTQSSEEVYSVDVLFRIFVLLSQSNKPLEYVNLSSDLFENPFAHLKFLSVFWTHSDAVSPKATLSALNCCSHLLHTRMHFSINPSEFPISFSDYQPLFFSLLVPLSLESQEIKHSAVNCLDEMNSFYPEPTSYDKEFFSDQFELLPSGIYRTIVRDVILCSMEFLFESSYITHFLEKLFSKFSEKDYASLEKFFIQNIFVFEANFSKKILLKSLLKVNTPFKFQETINFTENLLIAFKERLRDPNSPFSDSDFEVLQILINQYSVIGNVTLLNSENPKFLQVLLDIISLPSTNYKCAVLVKAVLTSISTNFFEHLQTQHQQTILFTLLPLMNTENDAIRSLVVSKVKGLITSPHVLICTIDSLVQNLNENAKQISLLLESIPKFDKLYSPNLLVKPIHDILVTILTKHNTVDVVDSEVMQNLEEKKDSPIERIKQLSLQCLAYIFDLLSGPDSIVDDEDTWSLSSAFSLDTIHQIQKQSQSIPTHRSALDLLSSLASFDPDIVLPKISNFFSNSIIMAQDDVYSMRILQNSFGNIFPHFLSGDENEADRVTKLLQVFVNSILRIPTSRRVTIFNILILSVSSKYLHTLLSLVLIKYLELTELKEKDDNNNDTDSNTTSINSSSNNASNEEEDEEEENENEDEENENISESPSSLIDFCHALCNTFTVTETTASLSQLSLSFSTLSSPSLSTFGIYNISNSPLNGKHHFDSSSSISSMNSNSNSNINNNNNTSHKEILSYLPSHWTPESTHILRNTILQFCINHVSSSEYVRKLLNQNQDPTSTQQELLRIFETMLVALRTITSRLSKLPHVSKGDKTSPSAQLKQSHEYGLQFLEVINSYLSTKSFISCVTKLLLHSDPQIRRRALLILNEKVANEKKGNEKSKKKVSEKQKQDTTFSQADIDLFINLAKDLSTVILGESSQVTPTTSSKKMIKEGQNSGLEEDIVKQTALLSLEILARSFAKQHPEPFIEIIPSLVSCMDVSRFTTLQTPHARHQVVASGLVCLATFCAELQTQVIPYLPTFFPILLWMLEDTFSIKNIPTTPKKSRTSPIPSPNTNTNTPKYDPEISELLQLSCLSSLEVIVSHIAVFLNPYLSRLLSILLYPTVISTPHIQIQARITSLLSLLPSALEARVLLSPISVTFDNISFMLSDPIQNKNSPIHLSLKAIFKIIEDICKAMPPQSLSTNHKNVFNLLLKAFNVLCGENSQNIPLMGAGLEIENAAVSSLMTLVMRLNESLFRPLFTTILEWGLGSYRTYKEKEYNHEEGSIIPSPLSSPQKNSELHAIYKSALFFQCMNSLTENLKGIIVPYFGYIWDDCVSFLEEFSGEKTTPLLSDNEDEFFAPEKTKKRKLHSEKRKSFIEQGKLLILNGVLSSLEKCFTHDKEGFIDQPKFDRILNPICNQLENISMGSTKVNEAEYKVWVENFVVPCLEKLGVCVGAPALLKPLNYQILRKASHSKPSVRIASIHAIKALHVQLEEKMLDLLPETMPTIAELLEDSDGDVEEATKDLVAFIESRIGEKGGIRDYL